MAEENMPQEQSAADTLSTIRALYAAYVSDMHKRKEEEGMAEYFSGWIGGSNRRDPLQDSFAANVEQEISRFAASSPDPAEVNALLQYMFTAHTQISAKDPCYLMMLAMHRNTGILIPLLTREDAAALLAVYEKVLPKRERMPVNVEAYKLLRKQAK